MTKIQRYLEDNTDDDRMLRLPPNVIDIILGFLPLRDAARTSVLSTKWRYVWADQTSLVLDKNFWEDLKQHKLSSGISIDFSDIVNTILLHHTGNVEKFVVDISDIRPERYCHANLWLSLLNSRSCVKVLSILNSKTNPFILPFFVFSAPVLKDCRISNSTGFVKLQRLRLYGITLDSCAIITPLLTSLALDHCLGIRGFCISAPILVSLSLRENDDLNLMPYLICKTIGVVCISVHKSIEDHGVAKSVNLQKLLSSWPKLAVFGLHESPLKYLTTGISPDNFSMLLKQLIHFTLVCIDLVQIAWILRIIVNSPLLRSVDIIWPNDPILAAPLEHQVAHNDLEVLKYLEEPNIMNHRMEQLHTVKIFSFSGSTTALQFVKIMLHCSPKLKQMLLEAVDPLFIPVSISKELMRLQRAYPKAEIIYGQIENALRS